MSTSPSNPKPLFLPPPGIQITSPDVNIADLDPVLHSFLIRAGFVSLHLFDDLLVASLGRGKGHKPGDAHVLGRAIDLLPPPYDAVELNIFVDVLGLLCRQFRLTFIPVPRPQRMDYLHIEMWEDSHTPERLHSEV